MKDIGKWYYLLNKRLLKRVEFVIMLAVLPLLIFGVRIGAGQEKGVLHIVLLTEAQPDPDTKETVEKLTGEESIIRYTVTEDEFFAKQMLLKQEADAVWQIPNRLEERMTDYVKKKKSFITVYQSSESTILNLSREKLYRILYPKLAYKQYEEFMKEKIFINNPNGTLLPADLAALREYHDAVDADRDFLEFLTPDGKEVVPERETMDYLLSPMRGLLAIWLFVAMMVANIYFLKDEKNGLFGFVDRGQRRYLGMVYKVSVSVNLLILMNLTLFFTGQMEEWSREIMGSALLFLSLLLIGEILITVFPSTYILGSLLFPISVYLILTAPVFVDLSLGVLRMAARANPVYYYLKVISDRFYAHSFVLYTVVIFVLLIMLRYRKKAVFGGF